MQTIFDRHVVPSMTTIRAHAWVLADHAAGITAERRAQLDRVEAYALRRGVHRHELMVEHYRPVTGGEWSTRVVYWSGEWVEFPGRLDRREALRQAAAIKGGR